MHLRSQGRRIYSPQGLTTSRYSSFQLAPQLGIEPRTCTLTVCRSTSELLRKSYFQAKTHVFFCQRGQLHVRIYQSCSTGPSETSQKIISLLIYHLFIIFNKMLRHPKRISALFQHNVITRQQFGNRKKDHKLP